MDPKGQPARIFSPSAIRPAEAQACSGVLDLLSDNLVKCPNCFHTRRGTEDEISIIRKQRKATRQKPILRKDDTPEGKKIWDAVDSAAEKAPDWIKDKLADVTQQEE